MSFCIQLSTSSMWDGVITEACLPYIYFPNDGRSVKLGFHTNIVIWGLDKVNKHFVSNIELSPFACALNVLTRMKTLVETGEPLSSVWSLSVFTFFRVSLQMKHEPVLRLTDMVWALGRESRRSQQISGAQAAIFQSIDNKMRWPWSA